MLMDSGEFNINRLKTKLASANADIRKATHISLDAFARTALNDLKRLYGRKLKSTQPRLSDLSLQEIGRQAAAPP